MWNNVVNAWWPLVFYPATDAPKFTKGMWAMIGVSIATLGVTWLVYKLERREWRRRSGDSGTASGSSRHLELGQQTSKRGEDYEGGSSGNDKAKG